jgi:hypothetical protein
MAIVQNFVAIRTLFLGHLLWNLQRCVKLNSYEKDTAYFVNDPE